MGRRKCQNSEEITTIRILKGLDHCRNLKPVGMPETRRFRQKDFMFFLYEKLCMHIFPFVQS